MNKKIITLVASFLFSLAIASAQQQYKCPMSGVIYGSYGYGWAALSWITALLIIALIVAAIYWLIKSANRKK